MKKLVRYFVEPSLVRRVTLVMLFAFVLVWVVLMCFLYFRVNQLDNNDARRQEWSREQMRLITRYADESHVRLAAEIISDRTNAIYRRDAGIGLFLMELSQRDGRVIYRSREARGTTLSTGRPGFADTTINGKPYRALLSEAGGWRLVVAEPKPELGWMLKRMHQDLTIFVIIAFPVVMLPLWFAVSRGLRPLKRLSASIARRGPEDLAALDVPVPYAELTPLTASLDRLLAQLRAKMEREHAFVADAAHELRTPMAVIAAQAHVLAKAEGAQQRLDAEHKLEQAVARASHLIGQLLELAHVDSDDRRDAGTRDVAQLVRSELALLAPQAMARGMDLSLDSPDVLLHPIEVHAFQSILQNLVINAIRYVQEGGQVAVALATRDGVLELEVSDNGPGIPEAQRDMVFERFYRGGNGDVQGSGLGLSIVRQACARLRGSVTLGGGPGGEGCSFVVTIPATRAWSGTGAE